jgi:hypothetical protein
MNIIATLFAALVLIPSVSSAAQEAASPSVPTAGSRVYAVSGNVSTKQGKNPAHRVINSEPLVSDTLISTGDKSSALVRFADGEVVTMQDNSVLYVRNYRYDAAKIGDSSIVLSMFKGGMRFITGLIGQNRKQAFRLSTPNATIGIRGTEFMVVMADKQMYGQVLQGSIDMTNAGGTIALGAGQSAVVTSPNALATLVAASAIPSGIFRELLSIPVNAAAIPAPALIPAPAIAIAPALATAKTPAKTPAKAPAKTPAKAPAAASAPAAAAPEPAKTADKNIVSKSRFGLALTGKVSTLGFGAELSTNIFDGVNARFGINGGNYKYNGNAGSSSYQNDLQLQSASLIFDWYPIKSSFRASGGLLYNNTKSVFVPTGSSLVLNGNQYFTSGTGPNVLSTFEGTMSFMPVAPYIGIGWGNPVEKNKGWGLVSDFGLLYQGEPTIDLVVGCATSCLTLQTDATAANAKLQSDLSKYKLWPVVSIGVSYQW